MAATTESAKAFTSVAERCVCPTFDAVEGGARRARHMLVDARHKAEDATAGTRMIVRRHPIASVFVGAAAGALLGAACGLLIACRRNAGLSRAAPLNLDLEGGIPC